MTPEARTGRGGRRLADAGALGVPLGVWILAGLFALVLALYSVLLPLYRAPDEPQHFDMIVQAQAGTAFDDGPDTMFSERVVESFDDYGFHGSRRLEERAPPHGSRETVNELGTNQPVSDVANLISVHPPLYYVVMAGMDRTVMDTYVLGGLPWDQTVGAYRLLNALLVMWLPVLAYLIAREMKSSPAVAGGAAVVPLLIPGLAHIGSTINNDNLHLVLGGLATLLLVKIAGGDLGLRLAVGVAVVTGATLLTKGFGFLLPPAIVLAYVLGTDREQWRLGAKRLVQAGAIVAVIGSWWWIRNLVAFDDIQPLHNAGVPEVPGFGGEPRRFLRIYAETMPKRFWGTFGWFELDVPTEFVWVASIPFIGLLVLGVLTRRQWRQRLLLVTMTIGLAVLTALFAYQEHLRTTRFPALQGRYLYGAVVGVAPLVSYGLSRLLRGRDRAIVPILLGGAAAAHFVAIRRLLNHFWDYGDSSVLEKLSAVAAWSPWPTAVTWALIVAVPLAWAGTMAYFVARRDRLGEPTPVGQ